ncbi:MAG: HNH endonuclease [Chromatiales bacterium]|nr:HNH endonuclease [Chromatiales bacterium]
MTVKDIENAFARYENGERPWRLVERDWYVANSTGILYPLKYIWALVTNSNPKSFNTRDARAELTERNYSVINKNQFSTQDAPVGKKKPGAKLVLILSYERSEEVKKAVLKRANGLCERCESPAPFKRKKDKTPYLEVHHKKQLAHGGEDTIKNAIALCPNCHRYEHYGV